jgi:protein SCO1/2
MLSIKNLIAAGSLASLLLLAGCSSSPAPEQAKTGTAAADSGGAVKQYPMRGEIMGLDANGHVATIKHEDIPGFMGAMTMGYPVKDQAEFGQLKVGEAITATVNVKGDDMWVSDFKPDTGAKP